MQSVIVKKNEAGQRLDKFLRKLMPTAGTGFLYKMLRKKNITLNGKRAEGGEIVAQGDTLSVFFSPETFAKMTGSTEASEDRDRKAILPFSRNSAAEYIRAYRTLLKYGISVLYEDDDILIADKPAGVLSQKATETDCSLNEWLIGYLLERGGISPEDPWRVPNTLAVVSGKNAFRRFTAPSAREKSMRKLRFEDTWKKTL